jgi:translation elongation factor EF-1alpha
MAKILIKEVYKITGLGNVLVGIVESDIVKIGMKANINGNIIEIKTIEMNRQMINEAKKGDNIGFNIKFIQKNYSSNKSFFKKLFNPFYEETEILVKQKNRIIDFN